jgi:hypothetical protein
VLQIDGLDMSHAELLDDLTAQNGELSLRFGCTDPHADNFVDDATVNDGSCFTKGNAPWSLKNPLHELSRAVPTYVYSDNQRMHPDDVLVMYQMADVIGKVLAEHEVVWWAADGSLLGALRNKGIIPHDDDVDYNILEDQIDIVKSSEFQDRLEDNGLHLVLPVSAHLQDRLYIWNYTSYNATKGKANSRGTKMKMDIWPMRRTPTALSGLVDEDKELQEAYKAKKKEVVPRKFPHDLCVTSEEFEQMEKTYPTKMTAGVHVGDWHCALTRYPFGSGEVFGPSVSVSERYLTSRYTNWKTEVACQGTLHHCLGISNSSHDMIGHAEPSKPLLDLIEPSAWKS